MHFLFPSLQCQHSVTPGWPVVRGATCESRQRFALTGKHDLQQGFINDFTRTWEGVRQQRDREAEREEEVKETVATVLIKWNLSEVICVLTSDVCIAKICTTSMFQNHFSSSLNSSSATFDCFTFITMIILNVYVIHLICISCHFLGSCHGKTEYTK